MPSLEHVATLDRPRSAAALWQRWASALLDLVFPPFCPVCRARLEEGRRDPLCGACWAGLPRIGPPWCRRCGQPMAGFPVADGPTAPASTPAEGGALCAACRRRPPAFAYARAAVRYEDGAREALHAFKFGGHRALARPLGDLLVDAVEGRLPAGAPDLLVPVPLHPRRERERGFNQSRLLAQRLGRAWGCPVRDVLARAVATPSQTSLDGAARRANVRRAFRLRRPELVAGRHVVLVDDILTTGATLSECARCLEEAGPRLVGVLAVARVV